MITRVAAAAAVVNGVIGHCRPSNIKLDWGPGSLTRNSTPLQHSTVLSCIPDSGKSPAGMGYCDHHENRKSVVGCDHLRCTQKGYHCQPLG